MSGLLSAIEVASRLGVSVRTLSNWIADGTLPAPVRRKNRRFWPESTITHFLSSLTQK